MCRIQNGNGLLQSVVLWGSAFDVSSLTYRAPRRTGPIMLWRPRDECPPAPPAMDCATIPNKYILAPYGAAATTDQPSGWSRMDDLQMFHDHKVSFVRFYNANQGLEHPQWSAGDGIFECSLMYYNQVAGSSSTTRFVFAWYDTTFRECCFSSEEKSLCNIVDPDDFTTTVVSEFPEYTEPGSKTVNAANQKDGPIMLWRPRDECPPAPLPTPAPTPAPAPPAPPAPRAASPPIPPKHHV